MGKGFFSVVLALVVIAFIAKDMQLQNLIYGGIQEVRNDVVLGQTINEQTYGLENGFLLTIREAIESMPRFTKTDERAKEAIAREYICSKILKWFDGYPGYSMYVGYIDPADYSEAPSVQSEIEPCFNFIYVDLLQKTAMIKDNDLIEFPYSLVGYRVAFMFEGNVSGIPFKTIIPEGTVIT